MKLRLKTKSQRLELEGSMKVRVRANERSGSSREIAWAKISDSVQRCAVSECESQLKAPWRHITDPAACLLRPALWQSLNLFPWCRNCIQIRLLLRLAIIHSSCEQLNTFLWNHWKNELILDVDHDQVYESACSIGFGFGVWVRLRPIDLIIIHPSVKD